MTAAISRATVEVVQPVDDTRWCFITLGTTDGVTGVGEATFQRHEAAILGHAADILPALIGAAAEPASVANRHGPNVAEAAVWSAVSHAVWDIAGKRADKPVSALLGSVLRETIPVYANINRRTRDRSPAGHARSAEDALAAGFEAFKIAPFDEVVRGDASRTRLAPAMAPGLDRIAAVREAIGPDRDLMVDCHWRFHTGGEAEQALDAVAPHRLFWFECPITEARETLDEIAGLRRRANALGMRLAGCETEVGVDGFEPFVAAGCYDVVMPDIKYVGSMEEMLALSAGLKPRNVEFSPHNPSGPVSHAASLHLCAAAAFFRRLEMQYDETPVFDALVDGALPGPKAGHVALPGAPGLGVALDESVLARYRVQQATYA